MQKPYNGILILKPSNQLEFETSECFKQQENIKDTETLHQCHQC